MTTDLNDRLNECAKILNDGKLLAILSGGDAIAQELKYHLVCLTGLYNRKKCHLRTLEKESSQGHAFTGFDTVSAFRNKGKKTAWQTWDVFPEASPIFAKLSQYPPILDDGDLEILERFVVLMDRSSTVASVDEVRFDMFARKQRPYLQQKQLCFNTLNVLHIRQAAYGVSQPSLSQKQRILLTGDGRRLVKSGRSTGQPFHHLQRVASNLLSVAPNQGVKEGASASN